MYPKVQAERRRLRCRLPLRLYGPANDRENDLLSQDRTATKCPNITNIDPHLSGIRPSSFDPETAYSRPLLLSAPWAFSTTRPWSDEPVDSWDILWDEKYKDEILMQDSVRDTFAVALKRLGYSLNSTDSKELQEAADSLKEQKHLVQAYVVDQVRDKMIGNEAALGVIYSGEAIYTQRENPNLEYVIPKEGSNVWIDGWVIPKQCPAQGKCPEISGFPLPPGNRPQEF